MRHPVILAVLAAVALTAACNGAKRASVVVDSAQTTTTPVHPETKVLVRTGTGLQVLTLPDGKAQLHTPPGMTIRAVSPNGRLLALTPEKEQPSGTTTIVVTDQLGVFNDRTYTLHGEFEPEAFSVNTDFLYVIEELDGERYRVRQLNLATGSVSDILGKDKEPITEDMSGIRGSQALAPDGLRLYTLYLRNTAEGPETFVHTLSLEMGWALCLDLPKSLTDVSHGGAVAVSPDSSRLYVLSGSPRQLAVINTESLEPVMVKPTPMVTASDRVAMTALADGTVVIATGNRLISLNPLRTEEPRVESISTPVSSLRTMPRTSQLVASAGDDLQVLDSGTGRVTSHLTVPGLTSIEAVS